MRRPGGVLWQHPDFLKLWTGQSISELAASISGPPLAAALMAAIGAASAILADCASFVASTAFMVSMRHRETPPQPEPGQKHPKMWPPVKEGLNWSCPSGWRAG